MSCSFVAKHYYGNADVSLGYQVVFVQNVKKAKNAVRFLGTSLKYIFKSA